jgi:hypothetical protein
VDRSVTGERDYIERNGLSGIGLETLEVWGHQRCIIRGNTVLGNRLDGCDMNFGFSSTDSEIDATGNAFSSSGFDVLPVSGGCSIYAEGAHGAGIVENVCEGNNLSRIPCHKSASDLNNGRSSPIHFGRDPGTDVGQATEVNLGDYVNQCNPRQGWAVALQTEARQGRAYPVGYMYPDYRRALVNRLEGRDYRRSAAGA